MHFPPGYTSLPEPVPRNRNCMERYSASAKRNKFLKRLLRLGHMDFQCAFWQIIYLFISPQKVIRDFLYQKQTKNQFARDDPAFLVLLSLILVVSSLLFGLVMQLSAFHLFKFILWVVFVDCIGIGLSTSNGLTATTCIWTRFCHCLQSCMCSSCRS